MSRDEVVIHGMHGAVLRIAGGDEQPDGVVIIRGCVFGTALNPDGVAALLHALTRFAEQADRGRRLRDAHTGDTEGRCTGHGQE